jgi:hypothetical protein
MKYCSEKLDKMFDTQMDLEKAEYKAEQKEKEQKRAIIEDIKRSHDNASKKKSAAKEVDDAANVLVSARHEYIEKKKELMEMLGRYVGELREQLCENYKVVEEAENNYYKALVNFNNSFGPYKKIITVEDSNKLMGEFIRSFNNQVLDFWNW